MPPTYYGPDFAGAFAEAFQTIQPVNLAVVGKSGVGKSTLVNAFFGIHLAETGIGEPVTKGVNYYTIAGRPISLYDCEGFEIGEDSATIFAAMADFITQKRRGPAEGHVHAIWYCIRSADKRFEQTQADFVTRLITLGTPVLIVLTQVPMKDGVLDPEAVEFADAIRAQFRDGDQHGLEDLLGRTIDLIPEAVRLALVAAQQVDIGRKGAKALSIVRTAAIAAAAAAAIPIPFAGLGALVPIQAAMLGKVAAIYGLPITASLAGQLATTAVVGQGARAIGAKAVEGLFRLIPGVNVVVGVVQAGGASTMTFAMGGAWMVVCEQLAKRSPQGLAGAVDSDELTRMFREAYRQRATPTDPESSD